MLWFLFVFLGQHLVFTCAEPNLCHKESRLPRQVSRHLLSNNLFLIKTVKTDYPIFSEYFSMTSSKQQAIQTSDSLTD